MLLKDKYSDHFESYSRAYYIRALEERTGKAYAQWRKEREVECLAESSAVQATGMFTLYPEESRQRQYDLCVSIPVASLVPTSLVLGAFIGNSWHFVVAYLLGAFALAWASGFMLVRVLPQALLSGWSWLTSGEKK